MPDSLLPIRISDLRLIKGDRAVLAGVNLRIDEPGITVIMGPNGAGKTMLLRCLHGLIKPDQGQITLGDLNVAASRGQHGLPAPGTATPNGSPESGLCGPRGCEIRAAAID